MMDEVERRLRAAMRGAVEQPPPGLMEAIRRRHRRHVRRVALGSAALTATFALAVPVFAHGLRASLRPGHPAAGHVAGSLSSAEHGTMLLTCGMANWGQLSANWRSGSLKAGPLWFVDGRRFGYVHYAVSGSRPAAAGSRGGALRDGVMIVEVADGSTVVVKAAPQAPPRFRFADGFDGTSPNRLPHGDTGFTVISCPRGTYGDNGGVTDFYLGFQINAGDSAPVDVWTSATTPPTRVIFTCPGRGCEG